MKKVLYVMSLVAATTLMASNVDIYGVAHMSVDNIDNGKTSTVKVASNSSRLGFKASHDVNDGLTIFVQYESGVDLSGQGYDDGNGGQSTSKGILFTETRESFIGVKTKGGTLKAGVLPVNDSWMYDYNLFGDQVGDLGNIWGRSSTFINRASGSISYAIPDLLEGFDATFTYLTDQSDEYKTAKPVAYGMAAIGDGKEITGYVAKLNYKIDKFKFGFGYFNISGDYYSKDGEDMTFTTSYTTDDFSIGGGYLRSEHGQGVYITHHSYTIGGSYTLNEYTFKTQFSTIDDEAANQDAEMIVVGIDYAFVKDAKVYVAYAQTNNDNAASYLANNYGHGKSAYGNPEAGEDPKIFSVGLIYSFGASIYKD